MAIRRSASEYGRSVGDEQLAVAGTAVALASVPATAIAAMVTNGAESLRLPAEKDRFEFVGETARAD